MKRLIGLRPSRATVIALVALFAALTGSAVADSLIDGGDVKNNSLTGKDIKDGSLVKKDFKKGQLPAGPQGAQGPQGVPGAPGRAGRDGFGLLSYPGVGFLFLAGETGGFIDAECPPGQYPTGGDALAFDENDNLHPELLLGQIFYVGLDDRPAGWRVFVADNSTGVDIVLFVDAICANADPAPDPIPLTKGSAKGPSPAGIRPLK